MIDPRREYLGSMRRMPFAEAERLHNDFGVPWASIVATVPVPTRSRFTDRARFLYEPDEDGGAVWILPVCVVDARYEEEIDPLAVVADLCRCVDLVAFDFQSRDRFALRTGAGVVLGAVTPQYCEPDSVKVWSDVGDWLRAGCSGLVLLTADCQPKGPDLAPAVCGRDLAGGSKSITHVG